MYLRHPLSAAFPTMSAEEQDALTADIEQHGQRDPITIYDGQVLDGWHRYQSCSMLGIEPRTVKLSTDVEPVAFVISMNKYRRHLTPSQMAIAVTSCNQWATAGNPNQKSNMEPGSTLADMAKQAGVSTKTIQQAKAATEAGLADKVRDGEMSVKKAAEIAKPKPVTPPPVVAPEPEQPQPEMVTISKEEYETTQSVLKEYEAESLATEAVFDADDKVAAAVAEIRKLTAKIVLLETQKTGLLNQCNELKRSSISKDRQIAKLEKELNKYKLEEVER